MAFPSALMYGMEKEDYWDGDPWLFAAYREKQRREDSAGDWRRWQLGAYVYTAILKAAPALNSLAPHAPDEWLEAPFGHERESAASDDGSKSGASSNGGTSEFAEHNMIADALMRATGSI